MDESGLLFFFVGLFSVSARRAAGVKSGNSLGPLTAAFLRVVAGRRPAQHSRPDKAAGRWEPPALNIKTWPIL